jgi:hypothetical protein
MHLDNEIAEIQGRIRSTAGEHDAVLLQLRRELQGARDEKTILEENLNRAMTNIREIEENYQSAIE